MRGPSPRMTIIVFVTAPALQRTATQELRAALRPGHKASTSSPQSPGNSAAHQDE